ncbi:MAG: Cation transport regulator ChaB [Gammaproteobacteria bacterium]|jgi:cation transport regulator|nr:Cation transport regulator ChaB [Gammaproteobacteria bacterium]
MPYQTNQVLPDSVKNHLPEHAQDIYREAFNSAYEEYKNPKKRRDPNESLEEISHRVAWNAVKQKYIKKADGNWHPKD